MFLNRSKLLVPMCYIRKPGQVNFPYFIGLHAVIWILKINNPSKWNGHIDDFLPKFFTYQKLVASIRWIVFRRQLCEAKTAVAYKARPCFDPLLPFLSKLNPMALTQMMPIHWNIKSTGTSFPEWHFWMNGTICIEKWIIII